MQIRVLFFGALADAAGRRAETAVLPEPASVNDLLAMYQAKLPQIQPMLSTLAVSVNQEYASVSAALHENDEVALLPPVSGGSAQIAKIAGAAVVREKIGVQMIAESIRQPADGACCVFEGMVRDNSRGRKTLFLDYEAYEPMALKEIEGLLGEARRKFEIREAAIVHRLGRLHIGETSVLVAVASAHRAAAFEACRWLIDTLKKRVPIWKKEYFEDGAVWADGEPFPPEVSTGSNEARDR
ncbi:MAG TPA: molybdenum cofactor biosynthesis protein MoaE [Terriglobales bacterium]|nr:molybdenum cofactor biosynthesis protein MoaE [Terriglobales bacterium]